MGGEMVRNNCFPVLAMAAMLAISKLKQQD